MPGVLGGPGGSARGITAEGYCGSCGRKVPSGRDHSELDLGLLAGVTDRGVRHTRNEDAMALATADTPGGPVAIAVVCDGVSTSPRPDDASLAAAQAAVRALLTSARRGEDPAEASLAAVQAAHQALAGHGLAGRGAVGDLHIGGHRQRRGHGVLARATAAPTGSARAPAPCASPRMTHWPRNWSPGAR